MRSPRARDAAVMFAFAAAGYVGGGAVERAANGAAWARGLCAAPGSGVRSLHGGRLDDITRISRVMVL